MDRTLELNRLKEDWLRDPCWDIEETEGFDDFKEELLAFRKAQEAEWESKQAKRLFDKSVQLGIPGNIRLTQHLESIELTFDKVQERLYKIQER